MNLKRTGGLILILLNGLTSFGAEQTILNCEGAGEEGRAINYTVNQHNNNLVLKKRIGDEEIAQAELSTPAQVIKGYGGTTLMFKDSGKSGYLLLYYHRAAAGDLVPKDTSLLDINLFQPSVRKLNTEGPRTDFICTSSER